jgi:hypothetical protein
MDVFPPPSKKQDVGGSDSDSQDSSGDHSGLPGSRRSLKEFWEVPNALARIFGQRGFNTAPGIPDQHGRSG